MTAPMIDRYEAAQERIALIQKIAATAGVKLPPLPDFATMHNLADELEAAQAWITSAEVALEPKSGRVLRVYAPKASTPAKVAPVKTTQPPRRHVFAFDNQ